MLYTNLAATKNVFWKMLEYYGQNPEQIFLEAGIDSKGPENPEARIRFSSVNEVLATLIKTSGDPCVGLKITEFWHPSYMHALGYAWLASNSLREALNRFVRYSQIVSDAGGFKTQTDSKTFSLIVDTDFSHLHLPEAIDATMAMVVHMCRLNCGNDFKPLSVNFVHPEPDCSEQFFEYFKSDVCFDGINNSILFSVEDIGAQLPGSNPHLASLNEKVITNYLISIDKEDIISRVNVCITDMLQSGNVASDAVAKNLGLSERSLQRRLKKEGTTFLTLKDEVRKDLSLDYIRNTNLEMAEIAFLLGYSEHSAFSRSFKRMTGMSPGEARALTVKN